MDVAASQQRCVGFQSRNGFVIPPMWNRPEEIGDLWIDAPSELNSWQQRSSSCSITATRRIGADWREDYNHHRPHSSLGYVTPVEFAARCAASAPKLLSATPQATSPLQQHSGFTQSRTLIAGDTRFGGRPPRSSSNTGCLVDRQAAGLVACSSPPFRARRAGTLQRPASDRIVHQHIAEAGADGPGFFRHRLIAIQVVL